MNDEDEDEHEHEYEDEHEHEHDAKKSIIDIIEHAGQPANVMVFGRIMSVLGVLDIEENVGLSNWG